MTPTAFQPFYYCYLWVFVYVYVCACPWRPEEPVTFPGVGVTGPLTLCVLRAQLRSGGIFTISLLGFYYLTIGYL